MPPTQHGQLILLLALPQRIDRKLILLVIAWREQEFIGRIRVQGQGEHIEQGAFAAAAMPHQGYVFLGVNRDLRNHQAKSRIINQARLDDISQRIKGCRGALK